MLWNKVLFWIWQEAFSLSSQIILIHMSCSTEISQSTSCWGLCSLGIYIQHKLFFMFFPSSTKQVILSLSITCSTKLTLSGWEALQCFAPSEQLVNQKKIFYYIGIYECFKIVKCFVSIIIFYLLFYVSQSNFLKVIIVAIIIINSQNYRESSNDSKNFQLLKAVVRWSQNRLFSTWQPSWNSQGFSKADCEVDSLSCCLSVQFSALNFVQAESHDGQGSKRGEKSKADHSSSFLLSATLKIV